MEENRKELKVSAIENGTVIDHIPAANVYQVMRILKLDECQEQILFGTNLESKKYGTKGIIKVRNRYFKDADLNKIAISAPTATIIVIKNYEVIEKKQVETPAEIIQFVKCVNPNCITNNEAVTTRFKVIKDDNIKLQCHYCEKFTDERNMVFI